MLEDDTASDQTYLCVANNTHGHVTASFKIETFGKHKLRPFVLVINGLLDVKHKVSMPMCFRRLKINYFVLGNES